MRTPIAGQHAIIVSFLILPTLLLAACSGALQPSGSTSRDEKPRQEITTAEVREATVGVSARAGAKESVSGARFVTQTEAKGGSGWEADTVLAVRYGAHDGHERVVLDLGTGDEPAREVPEWTLVSTPQRGLLRLTLPSVSQTAVSEGSLGDALLDRFYVVRAPDGGMFVDVLAREAFAHRVMELPNPARLVVDLRPTGAPLEARPPAVGGDTVLVEPRAGARIGNPLTVSGYSRNFEASNTIILEDSGGKVLARRTVPGNDWTSTWGYFEATLDIPRFAGEGILRVGAESARDGTFEGVEVPVKGTGRPNAPPRETNVGALTHEANPEPGLLRG